MTELYLITGFLGSGKTSFLSEFMKLFHGKSLQIIINEFGKSGVDGKLIDGSSEISGGSIFCSCRIDQFEKYLKTALEKSPDYIIVESSGLSDPTAISNILERYDDINYGGCVCIADALNLPKIYETARICKKQLSVSDVILLNKTDIATSEQISKSREIIKSYCPNVEINETSYGKIPYDFLEKINNKNDRSGCDFHTADINLHSLNVKISHDITLYELNKFIEMFVEDTFRIKGFINEYFVDCVGTSIKITQHAKPITPDNILTVLYGYGLKARRSVTKAAEWYSDKILEIN